MVVKKEIRVHSIKRYGWVPDLPDARDHMYAAPVAMLADASTEGGSSPKLSAGLRPGPVGQLHRQCHRRRGAVRAREAASHAGLRAVAPVHLLQRAGDRRNRRHRQRCADPRRHQGCCQAGRPAGDGLAVRHHASSRRSRRRRRSPMRCTTVPSATAGVTQTLTQMKGCLASGYPLRVRLHRLRQLRKPDGGARPASCRCPQPVKACSVAMR